LRGCAKQRRPGARCASTIFPGLDDDCRALRRRRAPARGPNQALIERVAGASAPARAGAARHEPAIEIRKLEKRYGALQALAGVDLEVAQGEFLGLLGPNGAGKTTLISIVAGLIRATSGEVRVMGANVVSDYRRARSLLGVVPQELVFDPFFSVRETLRLQAGYFRACGATTTGSTR
jgi:ABC-type glutathione transport system ATPase component